ncbi:MAG: hypothetical protein JO229_10070 [Alphaproteobacteria bacterium]|nr:hypothetical protein [Alphaproteobacteria bacterium]MBV9816081.1 hypothetical protein [Alphaproteobacteria bacterium]
MKSRVKNAARAAARAIVDRAATRIETHLTSSFALDPRTTPATKIGQLQLWHYYRAQIEAGCAPKLHETGFRCFSQFEEDGKILFIMAVLGIQEGVFLDLGSADGVNSNCANLALNFGWRGFFFDGNSSNIERGRTFYDRHPDTWAYPPIFVCAMINRENINQLLTEASVPSEVDFMSIDIDGNDYWIWDALSVTTPKVVMIETHIEFGMNDIVVPYDKDYVYPGRHPDYHGASPVAMEKLARRKGYRLVGANRYGFNTIYVREGLAPTLPTASVDSILSHPRNMQRAVLFEPIKDWEYVQD